VLPQVSPHKTFCGSQTPSCTSKSRATNSRNWVFPLSRPKSALSLSNRPKNTKRREIRPLSTVPENRQSSRTVLGDGRDLLEHSLSFDYQSMLGVSEGPFNSFPKGGGQVCIEEPRKVQNFCMVSRFDDNMPLPPSQNPPNYLPSSYHRWK
jgi:hypothetical protein